jgi:hypothetical protein
MKEVYLPFPKSHKVSSIDSSQEVPVYPFIIPESCNRNKKLKITSTDDLIFV